MNTLIASDFRFIEGIFVARAFHNDGAIYKMAFNEDINKAISHMGPNVDSITKHDITDEYLVHVYGEDVVSNLIKYKESLDGKNNNSR